MGHVYPQEWKSGKDETESRGRRRLKGHALEGGEAEGY